MITNNEFFKDIFGEKNIKFRCISIVNGRKPIDADSIYNENISEFLSQANNQQFEVYFVVNSGGYRDSEIKHFNALFIDLDCGRNEDGEYFDLDFIQEYKKAKLEMIHTSELPPSYIVETRNGLHVYWLLSEGAELEQFAICEEKLIKYFDADKKVKNPARLMRVPNFFWMKDPQNPYLVTILQRNEIRYDIKDIIDSLPPLQTIGMGGFRHSNKKECISTNLITERKTPGVSTNENNPFYSIESTNNKMHSRNKHLIYERLGDELREQLDAQSITLETHDDVYDYLKKQDLRRFLGVGPGSFNCIIHKDNTPSAGIFINKETGHYLYKCHSDKCGFHGTIIQVVGRMTNLNLYKTIQFLRYVFKVEYQDSDWKKEQKAILEENQRFLFRHNEIKEFYPEIFERIHHYLPQLYLLIGFAKE